MLEEIDRRLLVQYAREAILNSLMKKCAQPPKNVPGALQQIGAAFVTITKDGQLRGSTGTLNAHQPLFNDVIENARRAAFDDNRFEQLQKEEFDTIAIEISVLSSLQQRHERSVYDILDMLRKERPGLVLRYGYHQAAFLPQAWEHTPGAEEFLSQICMKAGLSSHAWQDKEMSKKLVYSTFTVEKITG